MDTPLATFEHGGCKAEVYETALPGQFNITYRNHAGEVLEEAQLTGVSSYKQRESEIYEHLADLCSGGAPKPEALSDAGEY